LAGFQVPADAPDPAPQEEHADHDASGRHAEDEAGGPRRARGRGRVIGACVVKLPQDQAVKVGAGRLVGGRQPARERRGRPGRQVRRAEQVTDGGPVPDEQVYFGMFGRRMAGVRPFQREELRVDRGQQAGVQRTEEPGPHRGISGLHGGFAGGVRRVHVPGQLARHHRGGQILARDRVPPARGRAGAQGTDGGYRDHHQHERGTERYQRAGRSLSKRPHSSLPTGKRAIKAFTPLIIMATG